MLTKQQEHQADRKDLLDCPPGAYRITWQLQSQQGRGKLQGITCKPDAGQILAALFRISELRETLQIGSS